jgi:hypothetical protein
MPSSILSCRLIFLLIYLFSFSRSEIIGSIRICALRVSFQEDETASTTGNGQFLTQNQGLECGVYTVDSAPHDKIYFESQIEAVSNYFNSVSYGKFNIDIERSSVYPEGLNESYLLPNTMNYYNPYNEIDIQENRLTELFKDALIAVESTSENNFSSYDLFVVFHAGIGQDFSLPFLDPTPEDIPSTFIDQSMIQEHLGITSLFLNGTEISRGILLPESQNHILFDISESMFADASEPCEYQYGLTGTFALMIGFSVGLPPMWNIDTGESGIGIFGLMDQGSNNGRGIIPSPPNAWTRIYSGWENPIMPDYNDKINLPARSENNIVKVPINDSEYFLIENRSNIVKNGMSLDSIRFLMIENNIYPPYIEILQDSIDLVKSNNGVIVSVPNYDIGLPASGLLIWHIDESIINSKITNYAINNDLENLGVNLEEADGSQDIGYASIFPFNDPSSGYFGDLWFQENSQYYLSNPNRKDLLPIFGDETIPSTESNNGSKSHILIKDISSSNDTMNFTILNSLIAENYIDSTVFIKSVFDIDRDGNNEIICKGIDSLYFFNFLNSSENKFHEVSNDELEVLFTVESDRTFIHVLERNFSSTLYSTYQYSFNGEEISLIAQKDTNIALYPVFMDDSLNIELKTKDQWIKYSKRVFGTPNNFGIDITTSGIQIDVFGDPITKWGDIEFDYIAGIDLDLDARVDILALDKTGKLYAFNHDLILLSGFPTDIPFIPPILIRDLIADSFPEIVAKNSDSTSIIILNNKGDELYNIATNKNNNLVCLGPINNRNSILTESSIYSFDISSETDGNEWSFEHGSSNKNRSLELLYSDSNKIFDDLLIRSYMYPNPIKNGFGTIRVETHNADFIDVVIYDILGKSINSFSKNLNECCSQITEWVWDASSIEMGVYFAHVNVKNQDGKDVKIVKVAVLK